MARTEIELNGGEYEYPSKKAMLKDVGRAILEDEEHAMTVRQLYYRFVALDLLENKESQYQYLCEAMKDARLEGTVPWDAIEDRTRSAVMGDPERVAAEERFSRALEFLKNAPERHELPRWTGQGRVVEVWVEKQALASVFSRVGDELGVTTLACRGYPSVTTLRDAAERLRGEDATVVYFGDYDPSGQDIERHIRDTLRGTFGVDVDVRRAALTRPQIDEHELPPQPAKRSDARYETFLEEHGDIAVELDALPPDTLTSLIREEVGALFDEEHYEEVVLPREREESERIAGRVADVLDV